MWKRPANFSTFVRIILEQQVSLASAQSTFNKLRAACGRTINAKRTLELGHDSLRELGFSRQKTRYTLAFAKDVAARKFSVSKLAQMSDDEARQAITARLGLGDWSADVYLMMALLRPDVFPPGDLALMKGIGQLDGGNYVSVDEVLNRAEAWRPFRSVAARMIWQSYLAKD